MRILFFLSSLTFCFASITLAKTSLAKQTTAAWEVVSTKNGMDAVLMPSAKVPLVTIVLVAKAGARTETRESNGLTHLWEHMFFKGNARIPDQEAFNRRVRQLGIVFNGDTSSEIVRYYFTLPSANLDAGIQFMADAISSPLLEQKELERERKVVLDEYDRNASQPGFQLNNIERMLIYGDKEYLRNPLGRRKIIETATREQLLQIKKDVFVPTNCALIVSGDFNRATLLDSIDQHFSAWTTPKDWTPVNRGPFPEFPKSDEVILTHPQAQNAMLQITYKGPRASIEPKDTYAADALINLLDHRSGKFYKKYQDSGLTLQSALGYHTQGQAGELVTYAMVNAKDLIKTRDLLYAEPAEWLKNDYFSNAQLDDARRKLIITHKFELNKPSEYSKTLAFWWGTTGMNYLSTYRQSVEAVSLIDIQNFVRKYFIGKNRLTTILVNSEDAKTYGIIDNSKPFSDKLLKNY
jgi:zinc protease